MVRSVRSARRPLRAIVLLAIVFLTVFAYERGVRSVHRWNPAEKRVPCGLVLTSAPDDGLLTEAADCGPVVLQAVDRIHVESDRAQREWFRVAFRGRAPPPAV